jgi:two-component system, LytTR family, sensor kinase
MPLFRKQQKPFLERVVDFDIEKRYTKGVRFLCHMLLWIIFLILSLFHYLKDFDFFSSFLFAIRNVICDVVFFYFFFYCIVKLLINRNYFILFLIGFVIAGYLWIISNYYIILFFDNFFSSRNREFSNEIHQYTQISVGYFLSIKYFSSEIFVVLSFVSIPSFIKILFDITKYYTKSIKQERENNALQIEKIQLEKNFLSAQLNPHFLFNTFNNLYALALKQSPVLPDIIERLSDMMRYTVYDATVEKVYLSSELEFLRNYVELEKLRHADSCDIQFLVRGEANISNIQITPLLVFPFVENAFKYGLKSDQKFVHIIVKNVEKYLTFTIENDKANSEKELIKDYGGVGIQNVKNRLELLYSENYSLDIMTTENMYKVTLAIHL